MGHSPPLWATCSQFAQSSSFWKEKPAELIGLSPHICHEASNAGVEGLSFGPFSWASFNAPLRPSTQTSSEYLHTITQSTQHIPLASRYESTSLSGYNTPSTCTFLQASGGGKKKKKSHRKIITICQGRNLWPRKDLSQELCSAGAARLLQRDSASSSIDNSHYIPLWSGDVLRGGCLQEQIQPTREFKCQPQLQQAPKSMAAPCRPQL